jgi:glycerol-3-phosphate acyltransferase PlsX
MVRNKLLQKIEADLAHFHHSHPHSASNDGNETAK